MSSSGNSQAQNSFTLLALSFSFPRAPLTPALPSISSRVFLPLECLKKLLSALETVNKFFLELLIFICQNVYYALCWSQFWATLVSCLNSSSPFCKNNFLHCKTPFLKTWLQAYWDSLDFILLCFHDVLNILFCQFSISKFQFYNKCLFALFSIFHMIIVLYFNSSWCFSLLIFIDK